MSDPFTLTLTILLLLVFIFTHLRCSYLLSFFQHNLIFDLCLRWNILYLIYFYFF